MSRHRTQEKHKTSLKALKTSSSLEIAEKVQKGIRIKENKYIYRVMGCKQLTYNQDFLRLSLGKKKVAHQKKYKDYYPFGSTMPGRTFNKNSHRFNFQGQESETELWGGEASFFKYRISDNRLGRFFSVDPLASKYAYNSTYAFSENRVIDGVELEGLEWKGTGKFGSYFTDQSRESNPVGWKPGPPLSDREMKAMMGFANMGMGLIGTVGAGAAAIPTGGASGFAMTLTIGEMALGFSQVADAVLGNPNENEVLHQSGTLPGLVAYASGSKYAPFIDALGAMGPQFIVDGPVGLIKGYAGLKEGMIGFKNANGLDGFYHALSLTDAGMDGYGLVMESYEILIDDLYNNESVSYTTSINYSYKIQNGDNLTSLATKFNTSISDLKQWNNLTNDNIDEGGSLTIKKSYSAVEEK